MNSKPSLKPQPVELDRRTFLRRSATATLLSGVPTGWMGRLFADDSPEVTEIRFGIIALTDCSPFVIGAEKGFFAKYGIRPTIAKGANWAAIRDALSNGDNQATHMLLGMPLASSMGLMGSPKKPMVIPWLVNRNGQAITLKADLKGQVQEAPRALKPIADKAKAAGTPMSFAMTFPPGTHAMWLRYFLGAGGIHPDRDVSLLTVPPPQMVANMKIGKMDGFCVGEPWNARAVADGIGFTAITTQRIWPDHPEKVCAFTAEFADKNPKTVKAILKGLHEASVWLDSPSNRAEQCEIVSRPAYINCPREIIFGRLGGTYDMGDGRTFQDDHPMIFSVRNCNYPQPKYAKWWLSQFRRWGMVQGAPDYDGVARSVFRPDLYSDAMKELGVEVAALDNRPETFFDGKTFDPAQPEAYAASFEIHSRKD
jgi:nitrate/nitrite transport system substrate-binding protein